MRRCPFSTRGPSHPASPEQPSSSPLGFELEPQIEVVVEGRVYRPDFRIKGTRVLVEFDGAVKYEDRRALFEEKRREDALRRPGWVVVRIVWADLADPQRLSPALRAAHCPSWPERTAYAGVRGS